MASSNSSVPWVLLGHVKQIIALALVGLMFTGCGADEGYSKKECEDTAQQIAEANKDLASTDRSTDFGEFSYQNMKRNLENWVIVYRGLCG